MSKKTIAVIIISTILAIALFFITPFFPLDEFLVASVAAAALVKEFL